MGVMKGDSRSLDYNSHSSLGSKGVLNFGANPSRKRFKLKQCEFAR